MFHHLRPAALLLVFACLLASAPGLRAGVLMVAPAAFQISDHNLQEVWLGSNLELYISSWDVENHSWAYFVAPVSFPQGAVPKKLTLYCLVNSSTVLDWFNVDLRRVDPATGAIQSLGSIDTTAATPSANRLTLSKTIGTSAVNNKVYSYQLCISYPYGCSSQVRFYGLKIEW